MVTSKIDTSIASGSSLTTNNSTKYNVNSWADRKEEFSSNLQEKNSFLISDEPRFYVIKRNEDDFSKASFLIQNDTFYSR